MVLHHIFRSTNNELCKKPSGQKVVTKCLPKREKEISFENNKKFWFWISNYFGKAFWTESINNIFSHSVCFTHSGLAYWVLRFDFLGNTLSADGPLISKFQMNSPFILDGFWHWLRRPKTAAIAISTATNWHCSSKRFIFDFNLPCFWWNRRTVARNKWKKNVSINCIISSHSN